MEFVLTSDQVNSRPPRQLRSRFAPRTDADPLEQSACLRKALLKVCEGASVAGVNCGAERQLLAFGRNLKTLPRREETPCELKTNVHREPLFSE